MTNNDPERTLLLTERALNIARMSFMVMTGYGNLRPEQWLTDHGVNPTYWKETSATHFEYMRKMDYEIADIALQEIEAILAKIKDGE